MAAKATSSAGPRNPPLSRRRAAPRVGQAGDLEVRSSLRNMVIDALAATGEWPIRVDVVTSTGSDDGHTKRWFVEYETGPHRRGIDQPDEPV